MSFDKLGYQQDAKVSLPKGWEIKKLGEVVDIVNGKSQAAVISENGQYPIYGSAGNLMGYATEYICEAGTTIIGRKGNISNPIFVEERFWNVDTAFGLFPKNGYSPKFIHYLCQTIDFKSRNRGTTIPSLVKSDLLTIVVPFISSLPEQQRIVSILDECFSAIERSRNNAEQNLKNAKELFESYLQGVFEKKGDGWEEKTLGEVCTLYQGIAINAKTKHALVEKSDLPLLRIKDLKNNTVEQFVDPDNFPKNALVNEADILYTRTGSLGLVFRGRRGVLHNNSFKVVPNNQIDKDFLFIWLQNPTFKSKIMELALKAAQPDITHAIFKIQMIALPPLLEQQTIVRQLDALRAETQKLEGVYQKKIADLEELKKSILQKAFSGELRGGEPVETKTKNLHVV